MNTRLTWQTVGLLAVVSAVVVALATLTGWTSAEVIAVAGILAGIGTGVVAGQAATGGVAQRVDQVHAETTAQTSQLATIERRVNGELDARIASHVKQGNADLLAVLREQGVIR